MSSNYSGPRMGMNQMNGNNRRPANLTRVPSNEKSAGGQHEELVKFMQDSWHKVVAAPEADRSQSVPVYYTQEKDSPPNPLVKDFVAFDLEGFWGMRVVMREQNFTTQPQQQQHS